MQVMRSFMMLPTVRSCRKKRVAAYARVSTDTDLQLNSLQNQRDYYIKKIDDNPDWELVGIFYDEGISGTSTRRRAGMKELLAMARKGSVDLVLCKSISRFARNTADLLKLTRDFKACSTEIIFEKENLSTLSADGDLMLELMGMFAQSESESISSNIRWRIQHDRENGISTPHFRVAGYSWVNGKLVINKPEAEVIEAIYELYELGFSGQAIAAELNSRIENHVLPASLSSRHFDSTSIYYILRNEIYCGDLLMGKYYTTSPIAGKKVRNRGERDMYLVEDDHEAIISRTRWNNIQQVIRERTAKRSG